MFWWGDSFPNFLYFLSTIGVSCKNTKIVCTCIKDCAHDFLPSFLSYSGWHTLPSHASAEACLTGWPNAQPQGRDKCSVARHHQANLMVCVMCSCCATSPYREVCRPCRVKGGIGSGETSGHDIYPVRPITTVSLATNTYCMMDGHSSCAPRTVGPKVQFSGACKQSHWWPARHTAGGHLLSVVQAATNIERL